MLLPEPHSKPQENLINAWDLRYDPARHDFDPKDPINTAFYDPTYPGWDKLPLALPGLRFVIGACGTKFGKTYGCAIRLIKEAWENPTMDERVWWVAPTYDQAENAMLFITSLLPEGSYKATTTRGKMRMTLLNDDGSPRSMVEFKSGDKPSSLRGYAVRFFVMDECAQGMPEASLTSIQTTITKTKGRGILISTPNGHGWFFEEYEKGQKYDNHGNPKYDENRKDPFPEYFSVRMPTHMNPHVELAEIEFKRRTMPEAMWRQEYLAEFLHDASKVFKADHVERMFELGSQRGGLIENPEPGHYYVMGADLGDKKDYTVLTVIDRQTKHVVWMERFNRRGWEYNKRRIVEVAKKWNNAYTVIDATGVGDPVFDDLRAAGIPMLPYSINSNEKKRMLIEKLMVAVENARFSVAPPSRKNMHFHDLRDEMKAFEYKYNKEGRGDLVQYGAPDRKHDDCVLSLAFAIWVADQPEFKYRHHKVRGY